MSHKQDVARALNWACNYRFQLPYLHALPRELQTEEVLKTLIAADKAHEAAKKALRKAYAEWSILQAIRSQST